MKQGDVNDQGSFGSVCRKIATPLGMVRPAGGQQCGPAYHNLMTMDPPASDRLPPATDCRAPIVSVLPASNVRTPVFVVPVPASTPFTVPEKAQAVVSMRFPPGVTSAQSDAYAFGTPIFNDVATNA